MKLYLQFVDGDGVLHEIAMPAYCEGGLLAGIDELGDTKILRIATAAGEARVLLQSDYRPDWQIAGWRRG